MFWRSNSVDFTKCGAVVVQPVPKFRGGCIGVDFCRGPRHSGRSAGLMGPTGRRAINSGPQNCPLAAREIWRSHKSPRTSGMINFRPPPCRLAPRAAERVFSTAVWGKLSGSELPILGLRQNPEAEVNALIYFTALFLAGKTYWCGVCLFRN